MRSRRSFMACSGRLALVPALSGLSACDQWLQQPIAIAAHLWVGYAPLFLAREKGWLDPKKVLLHKSGSAAESLKALAQGQVQGVALTLDEMLVARANGLPLSLVLVFNISAGADMVVVRPDIKSMADMRGKRLGLEAGSVGELMLGELLAAAGLTRRDVELQAVSPQQQLAAWQSRSVDALITYEPLATQLLAQGAVRLFDSRQIPNAIIDVLAIGREALDWRHGEAIRQLLQAHFWALDHLARNPQDAAYRMASHLGLPAAEVLSAFRGLLLPDANNNERLLRGDPPELLAKAQRLSALMVQTGLLKQPDSLADLVVSDYLPREARTLPP